MCLLVRGIELCRIRRSSPARIDYPSKGTYVSRYAETTLRGLGPPILRLSIGPQRARTPPTPFLLSSHHSWKLSTRFSRLTMDIFPGRRCKLPSETFRPLGTGTRRVRFQRGRDTKQASLAEEVFWCSGGREGLPRDRKLGLLIRTRLSCMTRR